MTGSNVKLGYQVSEHKKSCFVSETALKKVAESERFELSVPFGTLVFKTSAIDHSANSPLQNYEFFDN